MDLTGITNKNEYYSNHYFSTIFHDNVQETTRAWTADGSRAPLALLRQSAQQYYAVHDRYVRSSVNMQTLLNIKTMADSYLRALGYPEAAPNWIALDDDLSVPVYLELCRSSGAPLLWILLAASADSEAGIFDQNVFDGGAVTEEGGSLRPGMLSSDSNETLVTKIFFSSAEPPRFLVLIGMNQIALIDRNKWNEKRCLQFELEEIFSRMENSTLQAMAVLLHRTSLCPNDGRALLDDLDEQSRKHASGVSQNLKYALRESIELLGNEVLYDLKTRKDIDPETVDAGELTVECLRYMYRMLFVLFIEARPELGYAPMKAQSYASAYSLESLRDIADDVREELSAVGDGFYLHETLSKLFDLIYQGYPKTEAEFQKIETSESLHDIFLIAPLKAHIFDPEYTPMITEAKLRNRCMLGIIDRMSLTRSTGRKNDRRGRISYANLGINQMGAVYEALLSYRGFIAQQDLYEVKRAGDSFNELDVGYFVTEAELSQYTEEERVRYESGKTRGRLRMYQKGTFIYRLAGREREKSASYYTPESLTRCLVKYALQELLRDKSADEILQMTVCEPAMGSAAFLNEAINQLSEAYLSRKEKETGEMIRYEARFDELQKVKMYIADHNVYGIDLNAVAVELAEVSLWLNTIYAGGYVPWFGNQLVNGNSLIGARRQVYRIDSLQASSKGLRWYEAEPERLPLTKKRTKQQVYHFLLGDPGMCSYTDKVIKSLLPDDIKKMKTWNSRFTQPITDDEAVTLLRLSAVIDELWEKQVQLRKEVREKTWDNMSVYGHTDGIADSHTTIREKDRIYHQLYKSEEMRNAGPYARLKFAMDYWCALWFWPIEKADLLPSRSEFLFDMSLILEGTTGSVLVTGTEKREIEGQITLLPTEMQLLEAEIHSLYEGLGEVNLPDLRQKSPRLDLAAQIAEENHFMHWELEFAEVFADRGGFDLIIGNPPWIKLEWNEQDVLSDKNPMFAVKKLSASETAKQRGAALEDAGTWELYFSEYASMTGQKNFLNAFQNYPDLKGQQTNLFKCFLPQAWMFDSAHGVSAFVHPEGVYDDPKGGALREKMYARLRYHFQFSNEHKLFSEVDHHTQYSLNVYGGRQAASFDTIGNLFDVKSIEQCYDGDASAPVPGIKDENGDWNTTGHPSRILHITKKELALFARLFDGSENWKQARLPVLHAQELLSTLQCFANQEKTIASLGDRVFTTEMWHETNAQKDGTIRRNVHFPESSLDSIVSGPHIGVANPLFKTSRRVCSVNSDYDNVDLTEIPEQYMARCNYQSDIALDAYESRIPRMSNGKSYSSAYRVYMRRRMNASSERSLMPAILPPRTEHINTVFGICTDDTPLLAGCLAGLPYDFLIRAAGKGDIRYDLISTLPWLGDSIFADAIRLRALLLNCLTKYYAQLWEKEFQPAFAEETWAKPDPRLRPSRFTSLSRSWSWDTPLRTDYERRQALVELDVLTAMALGMTLEQLKTIYRIQFPVLQQYEQDTWYDADGRIVFTTNRSLTGVGYDRSTWEHEIKGAPAGKQFFRTITDDTQPGGPVERTITYTAPFDRCDREQDYETAWKFFSEKYNQ